MRAVEIAVEERLRSVVFAVLRAASYPMATMPAQNQAIGTPARQGYALQLDTVVRRAAVVRPSVGRSLGSGHLCALELQREPQICMFQISAAV